MSGETLWWIGNLALLVVVAPIAVALLAGLLKQVMRLNKLADAALENAVSLSGRLGALPKLLKTQQLTSAAYGLVGRYGGAIVKMVSA
jgi:hypothetical protein